jgi:hypothetical protein
MNPTLYIISANPQSQMPRLTRLCVFGGGKRAVGTRGRVRVT